MERTYWLDRKRAAMAMARFAATSEARLIHYEMAGRYSLKAAYAPFMLPRQGPATEGEREALRAPLSARARPPAIVRRQPPRRPGRRLGDGR